MSEDWKNSETEELFKAVLKLKTKGECAKFFRDLCTLSELKAMGERLAVAKMADKKIPYREIARQTGASTATVTRVAHWLHHGEGGYKLVLKRF
jgi:TrpR-related protein YerC/YecD